MPTALVIIGLAVLAMGNAHAAATLMRFPTTSATQIAFVARRGLWTAPLVGGSATEIYLGPGDVVAPHFSPDGHLIAFTRWLKGARDVYAIPSTGGVAERLTYDGAGSNGDNLVLGWTPDGTHIVFLSSHGAPNLWRYRAFTVPFAGGQPERLPLGRSGMLSFSADGRSVVFNRVFRNFELRKRYLGGQHQNLYRYDFGSKRLTRLTDWKGMDTAPMWVGRRVYFLSDRGAHFRENLWVYDLDTHSVRQITHFTDYDVDWPSTGAGGIAFQEGGRLYIMDPSTERLREVKIDVPATGADTTTYEAPAGEMVRTKDALGGIDYGLSPNGSALLVSAHGDIVRVPARGVPSDLTRTPGIDEDHPSWSPDGRLIAYTTDVTGEQQVAVRPIAGGPQRLLTHFAAGYFYTATWSPTGTVLAVADANHALWLVPVDEGGAHLIARDPYAEIRDATFSPDGRWLAYSTQRPTGLRAIHLRELSTGRDVVVSSPMDSDWLPVFTPDGRYLAFVSQRNELPFVSDRGDGSLISTLNSDGIYIAPLRRADGPPGGDAPQGSNAATGPVRIDVDDLMSRAVALPVTPTVIDLLEARGNTLFYEALPPQLIGGDLPGSSTSFHALDLSTLKDRTIIQGLSGHSLSADGTAVVFRRGKAWYIASTATNDAKESKLDFSKIRVPVNRRSGWTEMLTNAWRLDRDVFFNPTMNGTDWRAVCVAYAKLWPLIGSEQDFLYMLGQMQGEIASSHTFIDPSVAGGPPAPPPTPLLGADYTLDPATGRYRIERIYPGDQSRPALRGPLGAPGLGIKAGDYLLAVDGRQLHAPAAPLSVFAGLKGNLALTIAPTASGPRLTVIVNPVYDDLTIRRLAWVESNRRLVDRLSGGRLGYIALSDFDDEGSKEFVRQFYPQLDKQGLIFDVRWNSGGFTSQAVLEVLRRLREGVFVNREGALSPLPTSAPPPVMAVVTNDSSASDGDQFPYYFRKYGLGPIVGERTWGGVQGINGAWRLMDGTSVYIPKDALADRDGHWLIENAGVAPDTVVDTTPSDPPGTDPQLEAAVRACLDRLKHHTESPPKAPHWLPAYPPAGQVPGTFESRP